MKIACEDIVVSRGGDRSSSGARARWLSTIGVLSRSSIRRIGPMERQAEPLKLPESKLTLESQVSGFQETCGLSPDRLATTVSGRQHDST